MYLLKARTSFCSKSLDISSGVYLGRNSPKTVSPSAKNVSMSLSSKSRSSFSSLSDSVNLWTAGLLSTVACEACWLLFEPPPHPTKTNRADRTAAVRCFISKLQKS
nr:MAG TPA: hypothetical protein [Caudoviricetes sp.]